MRTHAPEDVRRLLAVRLDNIGDVVMLGPALRALRAAYPDAHITLMASPAGAQAAPMLPWIDEVWPLSPVWQDASWSMPFDPARERRLVSALRESRFDAAFIFTSFSQSPYPLAYACYMAGIPVRAGQSKEFGGSVLSHWVRAPADSMHQAERNLHLLASVGVAPSGAELTLAVPPESRASAHESLRRRGIDPEGRYVVVAPGASCAARRYDGARFAEATRLITAESGASAVVVGSAKERALVEAVASAAAPRAVALAGVLSLPELAAVIERAAVVVTNNSACLHIADAFRRPQVVLYAGTELESQWRPRSSPAVLLRRETDCSPCYAFDCAFAMQCLDIPPSQVASAARRLLEAKEMSFRAIRKEAAA